MCRGEGEGAVVELCNNLASGARIDNIKNFYDQREGKVFNNPMRPPIDINDVPIPDWDLFERVVYIDLCKVRSGEQLV